MKYFEFDSLYKFIISVGIILIVSPLVIFYLIFNNNINLLITKDEFNKLTQLSQQIISMRQKLYFSLINSYGCHIILGFAIIIGIGLIIFGIYGWKKVQGQIDLKSDLENEKLRKEIGISSEERIIKTEEEINNDTKMLGNMKSSTVYEYMKVENALFRKINKEFGTTHEVVQGVKIGTFEYDIIATSKHLFKKDYIFEVKYLKQNINNHWIDNILEQIDKQTRNYSENTNRIPYRILIIITENKNYEMVSDRVKQIDKKNNFRIIVEQRSKIEYLELN